MLRRTPSSPPVVLQPAEVAQRTNDLWTMRTGTFRLMWSLSDLVANDGMVVHVNFSASVQVLSDSAEQTLFVETFGRRETVTEDDLRQHLATALHAAAARLAAAEPASVLVDASAQSRWIDTLRTAAEAVAFGCGLRVSAPFDSNVSSEALDRQRQAEAQRTETQREAEARLAAAKHTAGLLREWRSMHEQWPDLSPGELLNRLAPADQASAVTDVLAASDTKPARFWAVAGYSVVRVDWQATLSEPAAILLPAALGPLRSIRASGNRLLVGAQRGVWVLNAADGAILRKLIVSDLVSEHGFSTVAETNDHVWAGHRDGGIFAWGPAGDEPALRVSLAQLGGAPTALHLVDDGKRVGAAVDTRWLSIGLDGALQTRWAAPSAIIAILTGDGRTDVICRDGTWTVFDQSGEVVAKRWTVSHAVAACRLPWLWSHRLLVVNDDGGLICFGIADDIVTHYTAPQGVGRGITVAGGKVVAMSADRNRVVVWPAGDGRHPISINISAVARARATDLAGIAI